MREAVHGVGFLYVGLGAGAAPAFTKLKYPASGGGGGPSRRRGGSEGMFEVEFTERRSVRARGGGGDDVIVGDCAEGVRDVERGSVDVIFLDACDGRV